MNRIGIAMLAIAAVIGAAEAAPVGSCDDMVAKFDAYLKTHPDATGTLRQTTSAQLMHQPSREAVQKAVKEGRQHLDGLLAKAKTQQKAGEEQACRGTLAEVAWMLKP